MGDPEKYQSSPHAETNAAPDLEKTTTSPSPVGTCFPETDLAQGIVGWEGQDDPANPQNFSHGKKWGLLALMSTITFISPLASSMFSPAIGYMAYDLKVTDQMLLSFSVSVFLLGYTVRLSHSSSADMLKVN